MMNKRNFLHASALAASLLALAASAQAQDFPPKKPVSLVVGFAAGGAADAATRLIAKKLGENIGQSVVVENKGGCLLYTSPSPRDRTRSRMPSSA